MVRLNGRNSGDNLICIHTILHQKELARSASSSYLSPVQLVHDDDSLNRPPTRERVERENQQFLDSMNVTKEKEWPCRILWTPSPQVC